MCSVFLILWNIICCSAHPHTVCPPPQSLWWHTMRMPPKEVQMKSLRHSAPRRSKRIESNCGKWIRKRKMENWIDSEWVRKITHFSLFQHNASTTKRKRVSRQRRSVVKVNKSFVLLLCSERDSGIGKQKPTSETIFSLSLGAIKLKKIKTNNN